MDSERPSRRGFLASCGVVLGATTAGCAYAPQSAGEANSSTDGTDASEGTGTGVPDDPTVTGAYRETIDSVAELRVYGSDGGSSGGTGFLYDSGRLITNQHVVSDAEAIYARFPEGDWQQATVVGTDVYSDLAVVEGATPPEGASAPPLLSEIPPVGTPVIAIGNPFGYTGSVSAGIVSGRNRTLPSVNGFSIPAAIQTDAGIDPGNSGGPLVTLDGGVAGAVNAGQGGTVGFAISSPLIQRVVPELIADGDYDHSYVGVQLMSVTPSIARANGFDRASGVYIHDVLADTPADGVLQGSDGEETVYGSAVPVGGDVVRRLDDRRIRTRQDLSAYLALHTRPGTTVTVGFLRDGRERTDELTLGDRPEP